MESMELGWPTTKGCIEPRLRPFDFSWDFVSFVVSIFLVRQGLPFLRLSFDFLRLKSEASDKAEEWQKG
jgi:hypothetical protein